MSQPAPVLAEVAVYSTDSTGDNFQTTNPLYQPSNARGVYGGQVIAQAVNAAFQTLENEKLAIHSLHSYFVLAGDPQHPIAFQVTRVRDGGSFATRIVNALQKGRIIYTCTISFHRPDTSPVVKFAASLPSTFPKPDEMQVIMPKFDDRSFGSLPRSKKKLDHVHGEEQEKNSEDRSHVTAVEWRHSHEDYDKVMGEPINASDQADDAKTSVIRQWARCIGELPDSPRDHAIALAYMSDTFSCMFTAVIHGGENLHWMVSLDHTIYFHNPNVRADRWIAVQNSSPWANDGRGLVIIKMWSETGELAATIVQEGLFRGGKPANL